MVVGFIDVKRPDEVGKRIVYGMEFIGVVETFHREHETFHIGEIKREAVVVECGIFDAHSEPSCVYQSREVHLSVAPDNQIAAGGFDFYML